MVRPRKMRTVQDIPSACYYKPKGVPYSQLKERTISLEELEAVRLADAEGMEHGKAAEMMEVSRPTFSRILSKARKSIAEAISGGMALRIDGGDFVLAETLCQKTKAVDNACTVRGMGRGLGKRARQGVGRNRRNVVSDDVSLDGRFEKEKDKKMKPAKIAVSSQGETLEDMVDPRFGRATGFLVIDVDTLETEYFDNSAATGMGHGAGIKTAENVSKLGVDVVLTGSVGPKASAALSAGGVDFVEGFNGMTVKEALDKFTEK